MKKFIAIVVLAAAPALFAQQTPNKTKTKSELKKVELSTEKSSANLEKVSSEPSLRVNSTKAKRTNAEVKARKEEAMKKNANSDRRAKSLKN